MITPAISYKNLKGPATIPLIGNLHQIKVDDLHNYIEKWADVYGPIYRIKLGPVKVTVVTDPEFIQNILKNRPEGFRRMKQIDEVFSGMGIKGVFNAEGEEWYKHRKLIAKGLDINHQKSYFPSILVSANRLLNKWKVIAATTEPYNIQQDSLKFALDVTATLSFGYDMNTLEHDDDIVQGYLSKIFPMLFKRISAPIPFWKYYKSKEDKIFEEAMKQLENFISIIINDGKKRIENNPSLKENPNNILEALIVSAAQDVDITEREIKSNLLTLMVAGVDTTTYTFGWIVYHLCKFQDVQNKVRAEAIKILGKDDQITDYNQLASFEYIDALIYESMRLKSVSPMLMHQANKEITINNYSFKKNETVIIESRYACKHTSHFDNASDFDVERWINKTPNKCEAGHDLTAYMPFGSGPRFCPGKNLAQLEMKIIISMLLKNYKIEFVTKEEDIKEVRAFSLKPSLFYIKLIKL